MNREAGYALLLQVFRASSLIQIMKGLQIFLRFPLHPALYEYNIPFSVSSNALRVKKIIQHVRYRTSGDGVALMGHITEDPSQNKDGKGAADRIKQDVHQSTLEVPARQMNA